jgi:hypothetical protein
VRTSSNDFTDDGLEPKDQGVAMCGGEGWRVVRMQTWVVTSPDQTILRPAERKWLGQTLGLDMVGSYQISIRPYFSPFNCQSDPTSSPIYLPFEVWRYVLLTYQLAG